jgi:hypothetical protein
LSTITVAMPVSRMVDDAPDLHGDQRREAFGGFVEDQQIGVGHQRAADGEHLLLAARQLPAAVVDALAQPRKGFHHPLEGPVALAVDAGARRHLTRFSRTDRLGKMPRPSGT